MSATSTSRAPSRVEWYEGKPILHSLGNFVFLQTAPWTRRGLWAELVVAAGTGDAQRP